jgi:hypothetical protein
MIHCGTADHNINLIFFPKKEKHKTPKQQDIKVGGQYWSAARHLTTQIENSPIRKKK